MNTAEWLKRRRVEQVGTVERGMERGRAAAEGHGWQLTWQQLLGLCVPLLAARIATGCAAGHCDHGAVAPRLLLLMPLAAETADGCVLIWAAGLLGCR